MNGSELARRLLEDEEVNPRDYLNKLTRDDLTKDGDLIFVRYNEEDSSNPLVRCPKCGQEGFLMNDFSYLAAGFNGIESGDPDDLNLQECGCGAKLSEENVEKMNQAEQDRREEEHYRQLNNRRV